MKHLNIKGHQDDDTQYSRHLKYLSVPQSHLVRDTDEAKRKERSVWQHFSPLTNTTDKILIEENNNELNSEKKKGRSVTWLNQKLSVL